MGHDFINSTPLIGMIHLPNLTRHGDYSTDKIIEYAIEEGKKLEEAGFNAILTENFSDVPFAKTMVSEFVFARFVQIISALKKSSSIPIGVNVLRNGCVQAMTIATATGIDFIRCNIWESAYLTDQGIIEGAAFDVINCKKDLKSWVKILADIHVKHARNMAQFSLVESAENALHRGQADGLILSGVATGEEPILDNFIELGNLGIRPFIGSGLSEKNLYLFKPYLGGAIVGSSIKIDNIVTNPVDLNKAVKLARLWYDQ